MQHKTVNRELLRKTIFSVSAVTRGVLTLFHGSYEIGSVLYRTALWNCFEGTDEFWPSTLRNLIMGNKISSHNVPHTPSPARNAPVSVNPPSQPGQRPETWTNRLEKVTECSCPRGNISVLVSSLVPAYRGNGGLQGVTGYTSSLAWNLENLLHNANALKRRTLPGI